MKEFKFDLFGSESADILARSMPLLLRDNSGLRSTDNNTRRETKEDLSRLSEESLEGEDFSFSERLMIL